jgi:hypothetical protein
MSSEDLVSEKAVIPVLQVDKPKGICMELRMHQVMRDSTAGINPFGAVAAKENL